MTNSTRVNHLRARRTTDFALSTATDVSTCGYASGDPKRPRTANSGFNCRVDTVNGVWGFCPTTVIAASDCGLAGSCVDAHSCVDGCGAVDQTDVTTFTCTASGQDFCSTALLTAGPDQTYAYLACAPTATTQHLLAQFTTPTDTPSSSSSIASTKASSGETRSSLSRPDPTTAVPSTSTSSPSLSPVATVSVVPSVAKGTDGTKDRTGAIVGGILGVVVFLCFLGFGLIWLRRRKKQHAERQRQAQDHGWQAGHSLQSLDAEGTDTRTDQKKYSGQGFMPVELPDRLQDSPVELGGDAHSIRKFGR